MSMQRLPAQGAVLEAATAGHFPPASARKVVRALIVGPLLQECTARPARCAAGKAQWL